VLVGSAGSRMENTPMNLDTMQIKAMFPCSNHLYFKTAWAGHAYVSTHIIGLCGDYVPTDRLGHETMRY